MRHVAIVGSGPAGFYTAEALLKSGDVAIDILDRLPVPYGLIRFGVAPDHQSIKAVARRYEKVALTPGVRFLGNVHLGADVSTEELLHYYDAVVLATGAPLDRGCWLSRSTGGLPAAATTSPLSTSRNTWVCCRARSASLWPSLGV